jgi:hypothetical protein
MVLELAVLAVQHQHFAVLAVLAVLEHQALLAQQLQQLAELLAQHLEEEAVVVVLQPMQ